MLIYLYGKDSYRRKKKLFDILERYKDKHRNSDVEYFDFDESEDNWEDAKDFLRQPSMFASSKMAVIKEGTKPDKKGWLDTLKEYKNSETVFILINDSSKKPKKKFKFLLDDEVKHQEFGELEGDDLRLFLNELLKENEIKLEKDAQDFLFSYISSSDDKSWLAVNEIKKIGLSGFNNPVSVSDLESIIPWSPKGKMFNETRKLLRSGVSAGLKLPVLEKLLIRDESDAHVFNMIGVQVKGRTSHILADLDIKIKSGELEYEEALLDFVLRVN